MNFEDVKLSYLLSCIVLGLIILSPTLFAVVTFPEGEKFSELWILGPNRMIESGALNVSANKLNTVYLGVSNHLGDLEYYAVYVKFRNQSEPLPDSDAGLPSSLSPIFEYRLFLRNNETLEKSFAFSFEDVTFEDDFIRVLRLLVNGHVVDVDKIVVWDDANNGFYCQLFFELWVYNPATSSFQFHNRAVWFWLNITKPM